jgi:uncharacterized protein
VERESLSFPSGSAICAAWLYLPPGPTGPVPCVVMANGFSLTRHDGLAGYAEALAQAGAAAIVFDHRYLGDSGGFPRQRFRAPHQLEDYKSAIALARRLPGIDPDRVIVWGFSFSGGTAAMAAADDPRVAGAILMCPFLDGIPRLLDSVRGAPMVSNWILLRGIRDVLGSHNLIPVTAPAGERAAMNFPGEADGFAASVPPGSPWRNEISPGVFVTVGLHRPIARARRVACPVWLALGERDISVGNTSIERFAARAPRAELHRYDVDHFQPLYGPDAARIAADQAAWLRATFPSTAAPAPAPDPQTA